MQSIWRFDRVNIERAGRVILRDLDWTLEPGRTWAVVGPVASGKTTLAETLQGKHRIATGTLTGPRRGVLLVGFREDSRRFSYARHYYQQRFNFLEPGDDRTLGDFLTAETPEPTALEAISRRLGLTGLQDRSLIQLSNGQMRRARLARALLKHPELLILDDPFIGLDAAGRIEVSDLLGQLVRDGQRVLLITRADAVPSWVTDVLTLGQASEIPLPLPSVHRGERVGVRGVLDSTGREDPSPPPPLPGVPGRGESERPIIEMRRVCVRYGDAAILTDVDWTVRAGQRWAVLGPNGSGKTTLLSLLCGDHPQAYSNEISLFGRRRGSGETIWEIKSRIGLLSPEFHLYFTEPLTAEQTAATGFHDTLTARPIGTRQRQRIRDLFAELAPELPLDRHFSRLSSGEQRLVLLVRALVKAPPLLILDEPFQTLDPATMLRARSWLDRNLEPTQTLLFVTHHAEELPASIDHRLELIALG